MNEMNKLMAEVHVKKQHEDKIRDLSAMFLQAEISRIGLIVVAANPEKYIRFSWTVANLFLEKQHKLNVEFDNEKFKEESKHDDT